MFYEPRHRRDRCHAIVVLMILVAIVTPMGDPFILMVAFLPIYLLWEMIALFVAKAAENEIDADDDGADDEGILQKVRTIENIYVPQYTHVDKE